MDEAKKLGGVMGRGGEGISHHLASQIGLTDGVWLGGRGDLETSDQVLSGHLLEDRIAWMAEAPMPEFQIHRKSGGRGQIGCLRDRDSGALEVGSVGGAGLSNEEGGAILVEVHSITFDGDGEPLIGRQVEDREEVVPEVWNIEDICELHIWLSLAILSGCKED